MTVALESDACKRVAPALRPYQQEAIRAIVGAVKRGVRSVLITMATGTGKTVVFSHLAVRAKRTLILAHRDELIKQARAKILATDPGADVGIVKAERREWDHRIVVASVQSLGSRRLREIPADISFLVTDEAHHGASESYQAIYRHLGAGMTGPVHLGVTATPNRTDNQGLGSIFAECVYEYGLFDAIRDGWLAPLRAKRVRTGISLKGVRTQAGDFDAGSLQSAINVANRNELTVQAWIEHAAGRPTVAFCAGVQHSHDLADLFRAAGVAAVAISGESLQSDREAALAGLGSGAVPIVCNAQVLTEGFDEPSIGCILLARPTQSEGLYIQMVGRGTRLHPGKADCLILDMADTVARLSPVQIADLDGAEEAEADGVLEVEREPAEGKPESDKTDGDGLHAEDVELGAKPKKIKVDLEWTANGAEIRHAMRFETHYTAAGQAILYIAVWWAGQGRWSRPAPFGDLDAGTRHLTGELEARCVAQVLAEDYYKVGGITGRGAGAIHPDQSWRRATAKPAQIAYAERCVPGCSRPRDGWRAMTAGEASDVITLYKARKRVTKAQALAHAGAA